MVDANMRWTADEAIRASRALAAHDVFWLEEPTIPDDVPGHVRIVREGALPVAAGENLRTVHEFERFIGAGGVSFPEPDVSNVGGVTAWLKVAHLAEAHNLPVTSHGVHDLHVHLLAAVPNASDLEVHGFGLERFIAHPLEIRDGEAIAPDRPGHGVESTGKVWRPFGPGDRVGVSHWTTLSTIAGWAQRGPRFRQGSGPHDPAVRGCWRRGGRDPPAHRSVPSTGRCALSKEMVPRISRVAVPKHPDEPGNTPDRDRVGPGREIARGESRLPGRAESQGYRGRCREPSSGQPTRFELNLQPEGGSADRADDPRPTCWHELTES